jgi:hypothetical protein
VQKFQYALKLEPCAGCDPGATDGIAGPATEKAVTEYQKFAVSKCPMVKPNGKPLDPETLACLGIKSPAPAPATHARATPSDGSAGNHAPG